MTAYPVPSVGRIVHYRSHGTPGGEFLPQCRAAIIAAVPGPAELAADQDADQDDTVYVDLVVFNPAGLFFNRCPQHELMPGEAPAHPGGTWHWPERVPGYTAAGFPTDALTGSGGTVPAATAERIDP